MNSESNSKKIRVLGNALSVVLPTETQNEFLRACLLSGPKAEQAWRRWRDQVGSLETVLNNGTSGVKSLLPLLHVSGVVEDSNDSTYVRAAYFREKLRSDTYRSICSKVLSALSKNKVPFVVLKGAALAEVIYEEPALRHCHDVDLLIATEDMDSAVSSVLSSGWTQRTGEIVEEAQSLRFEHESGLPLEMHSRLFRIPYYRVSSDAIRARSQSQIVCGVPSLILSPTDSLLHICGHAFCCRSRESLRWVADAWFLIHHYSDLSWDQFLTNAEQMRLGLPIFVSLSYLAEVLHVAIPQNVLDQLRDLAEQTDTAGRAAALVGAQSSSDGKFENIMRRADGWQERVRILNWMLFPPPVYFRWLYGVRKAWQLPFFYVRRPVRYVGRRLRHLLKWRKVPELSQQI